jgi:hypothetical protein
MSVVANRGLVATKRVLAAKRLPRLLVGMMAELPAPTPTKQEAELAEFRRRQHENVYRDSDHFELDPAAEKTDSTSSKETT